MKSLPSPFVIQIMPAIQVMQWITMVLILKNPFFFASILHANWRMFLCMVYKNWGKLIGTSNKKILSFVGVGLNKLIKAWPGIFWGTPWPKLIHKISYAC